MIFPSIRTITYESRYHFHIIYMNIFKRKQCILPTFVYAHYWSPGCSVPQCFADRHIKKTNNNQHTPKLQLQWWQTNTYFTLFASVEHVHCESKWTSTLSFIDILYIYLYISAKKMYFENKSKVLGSCHESSLVWWLGIVLECSYVCVSITYIHTCTWKFNNCIIHVH